MSSSAHSGGARAPPGGRNCQRTVGIGSAQTSHRHGDQRSIRQHVKGGNLFSNGGLFFTLDLDLMEGAEGFSSCSSHAHVLLLPAASLDSAAGLL